ncbi:hypothetical protein OH76DRAFT_1111009 [Lentinus brumalis]|uniref:Uncharacterized protein n=1 Tax=Lentinus brumalis TaxID=2498619 RepID=A0A371CV94_9APHY|nr:hypothetical protein OH76DRAFT_1111009 [Polyporus brumalis]
MSLLCSSFWRILVLWPSGSRRGGSRVVIGISLAGLSRINFATDSNFATAPSLRRLGLYSHVRKNSPWYKVHVNP